MNSSKAVLLANALQESRPGFSAAALGSDRGRQWLKDRAAVADVLAAASKRFDRMAFYRATEA